MARSNDRQAKKEKAFQERQLNKTDHEAIKKGKVRENMLLAREVEDYEPLFKKIAKLIPVDRDRYQ
jgi:hypothetical protein